MKKWIKKQLAHLRRAYKSWSVNWGMLLAAAGYLHEHIAQVLPTVKRIIPNDDVGTFVTGVGLVVVLLRFKTNKPLSEK